MGVMDKSTAAVNTAVHRSKLTIAAVNQNSTVTWLALRRRGRGRGLGRMCANIYISFFTVYSGVLLFGARHLADFIITYLPPRKSFFNAKWGGIYRRNSGGICRRESHFSTVNAAVFTAAIAPCNN